MNYGELRQMVRQLLAESSTAILSEATVGDEVKRAHFSLAKELGLIVKETTVNTVAGQWALSLPSDFAVLAGELTNVTNGSRLMLGTVNQIRRQASEDAFTASANQGQPEWFASLDGQKLGGVTGENGILLYPTPSSVLALRFSYFAFPTQFSSDGDVAWGGLWDEYHDLIAYRVAKKLYPRFGNGSAKDSGVWVQIYNDQLADLRRYMTRGKTKERRVVRSVRSRVRL